MNNLIIFLCWPLEIQWNGCLRALLALYFYMLFYIYISLFHFIMWWYEHWILPETCAPGRQQWLRIPTYLLYPGEWLSLKITLNSCILRWKLFPFLSDNSHKTQGWLPCLFASLKPQAPFFSLRHCSLMNIIPIAITWVKAYP